MGANQSYDGEITHDSWKGAHNAKHSRQEQQTKRGGDKLLRTADGGGKKLKAKPCPPHKPRIVEATHNSITLSWQPPRLNPHNPSNSATVIAYTVEMARFAPGSGKSHDNGGKLHQLGHWTTLTKTCQATSYCARDLDPDTTYAFRVRAENVHGVGKPSVPCEPSTTHMFESPAPDSVSLTSQAFGSPKSGSPLEKHFPRPSSPCSPSPPDLGGCSGAAPRLRRRHSFNVHLDGGAVTKIANHSEVVVCTNPDDPPPPSAMSHSQSCHDSLLSPMSISSTSSSSSSTLSPYSSLSSAFSPRHRYSDRRRGACANSGERSPRLYERANNASHPSASMSSLCRKNSYTNGRNPICSSTTSSSHNSSQGRKISLPILLPGTGTESLSRLRESRSSLRSSVPDVQVGQGQGVSQQPREVMVITVGANNGNTGRSSRRSSSGSVGSAAASNGHSRHSNRDRHSRASSGSGGSEVTSSRMSLEDSTSSEVSRGNRISIASSGSSGAAEGQAILDAEGFGRCGQFPSLSQRSSRSDVTLSNSKDGSKDSLCDLTSSNHSSMGEGNGEDLGDDDHTKITVDKRFGNNEQDDEKLHSFHKNINNNNSHNIDMRDGSANMTKQVDLDNCDDIYKLKEELRNFEITEEKLRFHDLGHSLNFQNHHSHHAQHDLNGGVEKGSYYANLENPWERDPSASGLSERILTAPFCDDIKMALYARDLPESSALGIPASGTLGESSEDPSHGANLRNDNSHHQSHGGGVSSAVFGDAGDFRTLRSVLQSNSMFVKAQRFSPDVVGVVVEEGGETCRTLTRARLTTIADADEDEDAVRITAL